MATTQRSRRRLSPIVYRGLRVLLDRRIAALAYLPLEEVEGAELERALDYIEWIADRHLSKTPRPETLARGASPVDSNQLPIPLEDS
jgi:hypothetical protein